MDLSSPVKGNNKKFLGSKLFGWDNINHALEKSDKYTMTLSCLSLKKIRFEIFNSIHKQFMKQLNSYSFHSISL